MGSSVLYRYGVSYGLKRVIGRKVEIGCFRSDEQIRNLCIDKSNGNSYKLL